MRRGGNYGLCVETDCIEEHRPGVIWKREVCV